MKAIGHGGPDYAEYGGHRHPFGRLGSLALEGLGPTRQGAGNEKHAQGGQYFHTEQRVIQRRAFGLFHRGAGQVIHLP